MAKKQNADASEWQDPVNSNEVIESMLADRPPEPPQIGDKVEVTHSNGTNTLFLTGGDEATGWLFSKANTAGKAYKVSFKLRDVTLIKKVE